MMQLKICIESASVMEGLWHETYIMDPILRLGKSICNMVEKVKILGRVFI